MQRVRCFILLSLSHLIAATSVNTCILPVFTASFTDGADAFGCVYDTLSSYRATTDIGGECISSSRYLQLSIPPSYNPWVNLYVTPPASALEYAVFSANGNTRSACVLQYDTLYKCENLVTIVEIVIANVDFWPHTGIVSFLNPCSTDSTQSADDTLESIFVAVVTIGSCLLVLLVALLCVWVWPEHAKRDDGATRTTTPQQKSRRQRMRHSIGKAFRAANALRTLDDATPPPPAQKLAASMKSDLPASMPINQVGGPEGGEAAQSLGCGYQRTSVPQRILRNSSSRGAPPGRSDAHHVMNMQKGYDQRGALAADVPRRRSTSSHNARISRSLQQRPPSHMRRHATSQ